MAKITITIDTEEEMVTGEIDGKSFPSEISSVYISRYNDYKGHPSLSWNVSIEHPTEDDDFRASTNFCSAGISLGAPVEKAKADIMNFMQSKRKR